MTYYRDTYAEHPDDRVNIEYKVQLDNDQSLVTLSGMYDQVKEETGANLEYSRLEKTRAVQSVASLSYTFFKNSNADFPSWMRRRQARKTLMIFSKFCGIRPKTQGSVHKVC